MEVTGGFEPPKKGFANLPIRPLWHVTSHETVELDFYV